MSKSVVAVVKKLLARGALVIGVLALVVMLLSLWPLPDTPRPGVAGDFVITNVTVVDVENGVLANNQNVVVRGGRIAAIVPVDTESADDSLTVIDGTDRYLIPGLWDMHTHSLKISPQYMHPLFIANGITGVRDMSGCMSESDSLFGCIEDREAWNAALANGSGLSPRYVLQSSFQINGGSEVPASFPDFFRARDVAEVRQLVTFYREAGADFLKTYTELSPETYRLLVEETRQQGLALAGHRPLAISLEEMLAAGQRSIEHPRLFLFECYVGAAEFRALENPLSAYDADFRQRLVAHHDATRCASLMQAMADSDTWWTPTMQVLQMGALAGDAAFRDDERLRYIPFLFRQLMWAPDADRAAQQAAPNADLYRLAQTHVDQAHTAGVRILVGTDAGDTHVFPGFGIHDELVELVHAGMPPADALRAATVGAAQFAGMEGVYGTITTGKVADMLLLDANPLEDVRHTQRIVGLFFNGQYFDRVALDELLTFADQQAGSLRTNLHLFWDALGSPLFRMQVAD